MTLTEIIQDVLLGDGKKASESGLSGMAIAPECEPDQFSLIANPPY